MVIFFASVSAGKPDDALKIIKVEIRPDPPKLGQDVTILATIQLSTLM